jgi:hypothetical protein
MAALLALRKDYSYSKCHEFNAESSGAVREGVMARRWRAVVLNAGEGRQMEVGRALRNARNTIESAHMETKLNSRIGRWRKASLVKGHPAPALKKKPNGHGYARQLLHTWSPGSISDQPGGRKGF